MKASSSPASESEESYSNHERCRQSSIVVVVKDTLLLQKWIELILLTVIVDRINNESGRRVLTTGFF